MKLSFLITRPTLKTVLLTTSCVALAGGMLHQRAHADDLQSKAPLTGEAASGNWTVDAPGVRRHITVADLPAPFDTKSTDNGAPMIPRPDDAWPKAPAGFKVEQFVTDLNNPRKIVTAPNGDLFIAESGPGRVRVLRAAAGSSKPDTNEIFVENLRQPFGIAFYPPGPHPQYIYVANTDSVVRYPYQNGDIKARGAEETIVPDLPGGGHLRGGGHWTRDIVFSKDGKQMFVSVGSHSNVDDNDDEIRRADILQFTPEGKNEHIYASGIRNPVGIAIQPQTGDLWCSVNERDGLGDDLVPDYITRVAANGFYGWPWYYMGSHQDPRHQDKHPDLRARAIVPDVLLQSHSASLCMTFYTGKQFPGQYAMDGFACEHGSWNRAKRTGYKVIRVPLRNGMPTGEYEDFITGFVTADGHVWGRPVGITVGQDGSLFFTDDGTNSVWRVSYTG